MSVFYIAVSHLVDVSKDFKAMRVDISWAQASCSSWSTRRLCLREWVVRIWIEATWRLLPILRWRLPETGLSVWLRLLETGLSRRSHHRSLEALLNGWIRGNYTGYEVHQFYQGRLCASSLRVLPLREIRDRDGVLVPEIMFR